MQLFCVYGILPWQEYVFLGGSPNTPYHYDANKADFNNVFRVYLLSLVYHSLLQQIRNNLYTTTCWNSTEDNSCHSKIMQTDYSIFSFSLYFPLSFCSYFSKVNINLGHPHVANKIFTATVANIEVINQLNVVYKDEDRKNMGFLRKNLIIM